MEQHGNRNGTGRRVALLAAFLLVCWTEAVAPARGQEAPPPASGAPAASANQGAWGPGLEWSPHKPSLVIEPDCFVSAEIALAFPHLSSFLTAPVHLGDTGPTTTVALHNARLDATVSPQFQLGALRFGPGYGELVLGYHFLVTEGSEGVPAFDASGPASLHSRLNLQTFDLDYARNDCSLGLDTVLSWYVGGRFQVVFFDTQAQSAATYEQARNYFFGAGVHGGFTATRALATGVDVFGRFDLALLGGYNTDQNFVVRTTGGTLEGAASRQQSQFAPSLAVQAGLSWCPPELPRLCVWGGYQFEQWWNIGRVEDSHGDLSSHGLFLSAEWNF
jgi:hypothetical protein